MLSPMIAARAATVITIGSESLSCDARTAPVISAVSPGSGIPADSAPMSTASTRYAKRVAGSVRKSSAVIAPRAYGPGLRSGDAVVHLPELQGALGRHRRRRGLLGERSAVPPLRVRLPVRTARRLLPGSERRARRVRRGGTHPRARPRRVRAHGLPGE